MHKRSGVTPALSRRGVQGPFLSSSVRVFKLIVGVVHRQIPLNPFLFNIILYLSSPGVWCDIWSSAPTRAGIPLSSNLHRRERTHIFFIVWESACLYKYWVIHIRPILHWRRLNAFVVFLQQIPMGHTMAPFYPCLPVRSWSAQSQYHHF